MDIRLSPAPSADGSRELEIKKKKLRDSCREFESVMISYLLKSMRDTIIRAEEPEPAREMYEDMFTGQISKEIGKNSAMGLGNLLYKKLEPLLKAQNAAERKAAESAVGDLAASTVPDGVEPGANAPAGPASPDPAGADASGAQSISLKK